MQTWDAITSRRNVRSFADRPIPAADLDRILEAGRRAPSSQNWQPWDFIVVTDRQQLNELAKVWRGAGHVARSVHCAADNLDSNAPQLAGLARSAAERVEQFSRDIRGQTVEDLVRTASELTRRQPALVFGLASLAGFLAFRVLKSSPPAGDRRDDRSHEPFGGPAGQFHGT